MNKLPLAIQPPYLLVGIIQLSKATLVLESKKMKLLCATVSDCFKGQKCIPGFPGLVEVGTDPGSGKILRCCSHDAGLVLYRIV